MKKALYLLLATAGTLSLAAQTVVLTSSQLKDSAGVPVADGIATITPTLCNGIPTPYRVIGGGTRTQTPVTVPVVAGVFSLPVADTGQTSPRICLGMTVKDRVTGATLIGKGYDKMQPSATASWCHPVAGVPTCNVDDYDPTVVPVLVQQAAFDAAGAAAAVQAASMQRASNLSDLASMTLARSNLGLGTAAMQPMSAFDAAGAATAAQAAAQAASAQRAANLSDLASVSIARTNLGLGAAATHGATITINGLPCALDGSCTVAGGGFGPVTDGIRNASQYTTGGGVDVVANALSAPGQVVNVGPAVGLHLTVIPGPSYPGSVIHDTTPGYEGNRYLDCLNQDKMHDARAGDGSHCRWDHATFDGMTNMGQNQQGLHFNSLWSFGPAANYSSNWRTISVESVKAVFGSRGISNGANITYRHNAIGDLNLFNTYAYFDSGFRTQSDEGFTGIRGYFVQNPTYWHGTSLSTGTGLTMPLLSDSTAAPSGKGEDNNHTTDGGYLLNISKGTISGTVTGTAVPVPGSAYLWQLPTSLTNLPTITAWGVCASPITESTPAQSNQPVSCVATVKAGTFTAGGLVLVAGATYAEQAPITAVSTKANGVQTLTIATRHRHSSPPTIIQGPPALYASWDANLAGTGMRTAYPTFGSLDGVNLIYGFYPQGTYHADFPDCGKQAFCPGLSGRNGFHLYPGAEVVANLSLKHDPQLEPNSIVFAAGDLLEAPQPDEVYMAGIKLLCVPATAPNGSASPCDSTVVGGTGAVSNFMPRLTQNANPFTIYKAYGGLYDGMTAHTTLGYFDVGSLHDTMPGYGLFKVLNMGPTQDAQLFSLPRGQVWWDDANHRLHTERIGSAEYLGPISAPTAGSSCSTVPAGTWVFSQDGKASYCNGTIWSQPFAPPTKIAPIQIALPTTAIAASACVAGSAAMPGVVAGGGVTAGTAFGYSFAGDPTTIAGYGSTAALTFWAWPTAGNFNYKVCNQTSASVTPGAVSLNVSAIQ